MNPARTEPYLNQDFGPLGELLDDPEIMEIMVNGHQHIYIEKHGQLIEMPHAFRDEQHLVEVIQRIAGPLGRELNESNPILDLRLPDGSRVHVVGRPIALGGPALNIRKFSRKPLSAADLIGFGAWTAEMVAFLQASVQAQLNVVFAGGAGSGKTTVANIAAGMIPKGERLITVEHVSELLLDQPHVVSLETRPPNLEGRGEITMRHLIESATKMRPDRIIAGEVHGGEVYPLIMAINSGYSGSMLNLHASSPADVLLRLEIMMAEGNPSLPVLAIREQLANAIDIIVYQQRLRDGHRRILAISEVVGVKNGLIDLQNIFTFVHTGYNRSSDTVTGHFTPTGFIPTFLPRLQEIDAAFSEDFFTPFSA